jgi:hypothetical protein
MSVEPGIDRRTLLRWLVALGLAGECLTRGRPSVAGELPGRLPKLFAARESAVVLGRAYLDLRPEEGDSTILLRRLGISSRALDEAAARESIPSVLKLRHREDFLKGRIVELQNWFLSETELRLSALVCLHATS